MSGLHGHIPHLYENVGFKFSDIKNILQDLLDGKLENTYEKVDGQNIFFSYNFEKDCVVFARNKTDIKNGGMTFNDLKKKWDYAPFVKVSYLRSYNFLNEIFLQINENLLLDVFLSPKDNLNFWFSAELITLINPNVLYYTNNCVVLHKAVYKFDQSIKNIITQKEKINQFNILLFLTKSVKCNTTWKIHTPISIDFTKKQAEITKNKIREEFIKFTLEHKIHLYDTIEFFLKRKFINNYLQDFDEHAQEKISEIFLAKKYKKYKKLDLQHFLPESQVSGVYNLIRKEDKIIKELIRPVKLFIENLANLILINIDSALIDQPKQEVIRLQNVIHYQINRLKKAKPKELQQFLLENNQIEEEFISSIEGITFSYQEVTYKLTGMFSMLNKLFGMTRY